MSRTPAPPPRKRPELERTAPAAGRQPNIVIINCDDLGYGDLTAYGGTCIDTPHIDGLAEDGARFTSFYSCNALCTPSRFGLLTGALSRPGGLGWLVLPERIGPRPEGPGPHSSDRADRGWWRLARVLSNWHLMDFAPLPRVKGIPLKKSPSRTRSRPRATGRAWSASGTWGSSPCTRSSTPSATASTSSTACRTATT
jgi:hypothetical protein